jgi:hypothetical protein
MFFVAEHRAGIFDTIPTIESDDDGRKRLVLYSPPKSADLGYELIDVLIAPFTTIGFTATACPHRVAGRGFVRFTLTDLAETVPQVRSAPEKFSIRLMFLILAWGIAVVCGMVAMIDYSTTEGAAAQTESQWPGNTSLSRSEESFTLLMFVHPQCPCSRASIGELAELMAGSQKRLTAKVIVLAPEGWSQSRIQSDIWRSAAAIPGVTVEMDPEGGEARRFGALTSGQVLLYDPQGRLSFRGGITGARGHFGSNSGREAVSSLIGDQQTPEAPAQCPVFGCPLFTTTN